MQTTVLVFGKKMWNTSFLLFLCLAFISYAVFVSATEEGSGQNFFQDTDQDGLSNDEERAYGTDSNNADTDGDGYSDGVEVESGYDPLKPAPGDRVVAEDIVPNSEIKGVADENNLTMQTSNALVKIVENASVNGNSSEIKAEDIDSALQSVLGSSDEALVLPEIDINEIKVKKVSSRLKGDKREEQERKDVLEYLTVMGYIMINNSPITIQNEDDIQKTAEKIGENSLASLTAGDLTYLDSLEERGAKLLEETKDMEVPEAMLDTHVKALQLGAYAVGLKENIRGNQADPLGQVADLGSTQAFLLEVKSLINDIQTKLNNYGIEDLPIDF